MATGNSDTTSKEHQVLQKYYARLTEAITNSATLATLAGKLYSAGLISESTKTKVINENSNLKVKTHYLLDESMSLIAHDCTKFTKIISVLQKIPPILSDIAIEMKRKCGKKTIIIHYINLTEQTKIIIYIYFYRSAE